ncbi:MAG: hypothetical protein K6F92_06150 [Lachnospiraceae bacterium]|nr:hypothetical protein [Lachnospiraceae bacterium]
MRDLDELMEIETGLKEMFDDRLEEVLIKLNRSDKLDEFLDLVGFFEEYELIPKYQTYKSGKIVVVGESELTEKILTGVAKDMGIMRDRLEFCLGYKEAKTYNYKKLQYKPEYSAILVGPMPHSGNAKDDYSSIIAALEQEDGYPPVRRMGSNSLKITKSSFRVALTELIEQNVVSVW